MGTDHSKKKDDEKKSKIKKPLKKPKAIDKIKKQSGKTTVPDSQKKNQVKKRQSKKTTITDTQKRGQTGLRYDLYDGTKKPKKKEDIKFIYDDDPKYRAKPSPGSKGRRKKKKDTKFLPHKTKLGVMV